MENANSISQKGKKINVSTIVGMGLLTAIVVVLYFVSMGLQVGFFNITLTLVPIVVGAALYGWKSGAWLGFVFGMTVLVTGGANAFLAINIPGTIITVLLKGILAGLCAALVYKAIAKKNDFLGALIAGITAPIVNTGIFVIGCLVFFYDTMAAGASQTGQNILVFILVAYVGLNFFIELGINLVINPAIVQIVKIGKAKIVKKQ